jgi:hypothetical protein
MKNNIKLLPEEVYLKKILDYDPNSGDLFRKYRPMEHFTNKSRFTWYNRHLANTKIDKVNSEGYLNMCIDGIVYKAHRLIWKLYYGEDPLDMLVDHINGIKDDNRICNLRLANNSENCKNKNNLSKANSSGHPGVHYKTRDGIWVAQIQINGKRKYVGGYKTIEEAIEAREKAAKEHYGEFYADCSST